MKAQVPVFDSGTSGGTHKKKEDKLSEDDRNRSSSPIPAVDPAGITVPCFDPLPWNRYFDHQHDVIINDNKDVREESNKIFNIGLIVLMLITCYRMMRFFILVSFLAISCVQSR